MTQCGSLYGLAVFFAITFRGDQYVLDRHIFEVDQVNIPGFLLYVFSFQRYRYGYIFNNVFGEVFDQCFFVGRFES